MPITPSSLPQLFDSHCHLDRLDLNPFAGNLADALTTAQHVGVTQFLCVAINLTHFPKILNIARNFSGVYISAGLHPGERVTHEPTFDDLIAISQLPEVVAIGETGLDYSYCNQKYHQCDHHLQQERFRLHINVARTVGKPLIIHSRAARSDTLKILIEENARDVGGVMHCFTEDWDTACAVLDLGFYISFSGIITFRKATELREVALQIPLESILIETDSPYLAPMPYRGKSNHPGWLPIIAEHLANLKKVDLATFAEITTNNCLKMISTNLKKN